VNAGCNNTANFLNRERPILTPQFEFLLHLTVNPIARFTDHDPLKPIYAAMVMMAHDGKGQLSVYWSHDFGKAPVTSWTAPICRQIGDQMTAKADLGGVAGGRHHFERALCTTSV
jgi:hypothetical protein